MAIDNWGYGESGGGGVSGIPTFPDTGSLNALAIETGALVLTIGDIFSITNIIASNTGATTITINGATPIAVIGLNNTAMQGHELIINLDAVFLLNSAGTVTLLGATGGALQIADGVQNHHAVSIGQLVTQLGAKLTTTNNLSEIAAEGSTAQAAARVNLGVDTSNFLQTPNLLSEIAALGSTAQATAQSNLGISGGGGGSGRLLGTMLVISSGTYPLATGTNTIYAEMVGAGSGSSGVAAPGTAACAVSREGFPGAYLEVQIPASQLSTYATNTIIITIGASGSAGGSPGAPTAGGNTTIDTNIAIAQGGPAKTAPYSLVAGLTVTEIFGWDYSTQSWSGSVTSPSVILKMKGGLVYETDGPMYGIANGAPLSSTGLSFAGGLSSYGFSFFGNYQNAAAYGAGGSAKFSVQNGTLRAGSNGINGAVRLWFYS